MNIKNVYNKLLIKTSSFRWAHWSIIILSVLMTISAWYFVKEQSSQEIKAHFDQRADQSVELILERMQKYEEVLWAGVANIRSHDYSITPEEWKTFIDSLQIEKKYPGIYGIGIIDYVPKEKMAEYLVEQRKSRPNFRVHPPHLISEYYPLTLIEPLDKNLQALGLDITYENRRYSAALKARDTKKAQITAPVVLAQDSIKTPGR